MQLVCATANPHKVDEIAAVLGDLVELIARPDHVPDVVEDAGTLEGNARLKARAICDATGLPAVADDTGLFVDALGGEPGVETAYFAGPHATFAENRAKMLRVLDGVTERGAAFVTVALVVWPTGEELLVRGECRGIIADAERSGRGWGYDPLFVPVDHNPEGRTFSQMTDDEKNAISHRGRAFAALRDALMAR
ncbi:MAG: RdgB/HAM1 family non-canonical purine NTP pyrophosphatase [Acidimicrobiaceae bacterium]|nr:RdgB/HAM1 family non-canonical purine NTP pyrophosphatase [Acidimicrobiaceae bacterium]